MKMIFRVTVLLILCLSYSFAQDLEKEIQPIKDNFKKINSISEWTSITKKQLWETTEGGEATYYFKNDVLLKIVVRSFGETRKAIHEFYLQNGELSFSYYKETIYNRPITWDSTAMLENNDNQVFDIAKSEIEEERSYFSDGQLIRQINNQDCGSPHSSKYLEAEYKRLIMQFNKYRELIKY